MKKIILLTISAIIAFFSLIIVIMFFNFNNQHKDLHNRYDAEINVIENRIDNMWKIISDKFNLSQQYFNNFKEIAEINIGAFKDGGEMWKWINTNIPQIDPSIYKEVLSTIESERLSLEKSQNQMIDIVREHNNLVTKIPSSWFINDKDILEWDVISSKDTKEIMITHEDNRSLNDMLNH